MRIGQGDRSYQAATRRLKPQLIGYSRKGQVVTQKNNHLQVNLKFLPEEDGVTFKLAASFYDAVPGGSPRPANWSKLDVGSPIGHASGGGPILYRPALRAVHKTWPRYVCCLFRQDRHWRRQGAFRNSCLPPPIPAITSTSRLFSKPNDVPARNTVGREQHNRSRNIPDQPIGTKIVKLAASSDSGRKSSLLRPRRPGRNRRRCIENHSHSAAQPISQ